MRHERIRGLCAIAPLFVVACNWGHAEACSQPGLQRSDLKPLPQRFAAPIPADDRLCAAKWGLKGPVSYTVPSLAIARLMRQCLGEGDDRLRRGNSALVDDEGWTNFQRRK